MSGAAPGMRVRLDVAYVGGAFFGWQEQPDRRTVQGELKRETAYLLGRNVTVTGAGRTDTGVHARGQVAHLDVADAGEFERLERALDRRLSEEIQITRVRLVSPDFHAIRSALSRRYHYHLFFGRDIFRPHVWQVRRPLDRAAMDAAAACLAGEHDFSSFCKTASLKDDGNRCRIDLCDFEWQDDSAIFRVRGNRFLHHMVRILVGTLVEIGRGAMAADRLPAILAARDRTQAGPMAPANGLFLEEVEYPDRLLDPGFREPEGGDGGTGEPPDGGGSNP